jgi:hypothetical protein
MKYFAGCIVLAVTVVTVHFQQYLISDYLGYVKGDVKDHGTAPFSISRQVAMVHHHGIHINGTQETFREIDDEEPIISRQEKKKGPPHKTHVKRNNSGAFQQGLATSDVLQLDTLPTTAMSTSLNNSKQKAVIVDTRKESTKKAAAKETVQEKAQNFNIENNGSKEEVEQKAATSDAPQAHTVPPTELTGSSLSVKLENGTRTVSKRKPLAEMSDHDKRAAELAFYQHHHEQMKLLVNESSLIDWNRERRRKGQYSRWYEFFKSYDLGPHTTRIGRGVVNLVPNTTLIGRGLESYKFFSYNRSLCVPAKLFTQYREASQRANHTLPRLRHVLLSKLNQDFGATSTHIPGLSGRFGNLVADWKNEGCSEQMVFDYINHPDTLAVFTIQSQIYDHPKIISMPLGMSGASQDHLMNFSQIYSPERPDPLMINMMDRGGARSFMYPIMEKFQKQYNITIVNSYQNYGDGNNGTRYCSTPDKKLVRLCYYGEMLTSKFILSPSGLGRDCYRNWEAMFMGIIPILDGRHSETDGWFHRTLADLPVASIDDYNHLTLEYLEQEYARIVYQTDPATYDYRKLTRWYWRDMAYRIANGELVLSPPPNGRTFYTNITARQLT